MKVQLSYGCNVLDGSLGRGLMIDRHKILYFTSHFPSLTLSGCWFGSKVCKSY